MVSYYMHFNELSTAGLTFKPIQPYTSEKRVRHADLSHETHSPAVCLTLNTWPVFCTLTSPVHNSRSHSCGMVGWFTYEKR